VRRSPSAALSPWRARASSSAPSVSPRRSPQPPRSVHPPASPAPRPPTPRRPPAPCRAAAARTDRGAAQAALFAAAAAQDPGAGALRARLGGALADAGRLEGAEGNLSAALATLGADAAAGDAGARALAAGVRLRLALVLERAGAPRRAAPLLEALVAGAPDAAVLWYLRARAAPAARARARAAAQRLFPLLPARARAPRVLQPDGAEAKVNTTTFDGSAGSASGGKGMRWLVVTPGPEGWGNRVLVLASAALFAMHSGRVALPPVQSGHVSSIPPY